MREKHYSLIAFDKRVTFWLQHVQSLPCACVYVALFARRLAYNHYAIAHAYNAANAQDSDWAYFEAKKLLSRRRQSEYSLLCIVEICYDIMSILKVGSNLHVYLPLVLKIFWFF